MFETVLKVPFEVSAIRVEKFAFSVILAVDKVPNIFGSVLKGESSLAVLLVLFKVAFVGCIVRFFNAIALLIPEVPLALVVVVLGRKLSNPVSEPLVPLAFEVVIIGPGVGAAAMGLALKVLSLVNFVIFKYLFARATSLIVLPFPLVDSAGFINHNSNVVALVFRYNPIVKSIVIKPKLKSWEVFELIFEIRVAEN